MAHSTVFLLISVAGCSSAPLDDTADLAIPDAAIPDLAVSDLARPIPCGDGSCPATQLCVYETIGCPVDLSMETDGSICVFTIEGCSLPPRCTDAPVCDGGCACLALPCIYHFGQCEGRSVYCGCL